MAKRRILVVDDEEVIRLSIQRALTREGLESEMASGGRMALEMLQEKDYQVVVTDLKMPGMGGMEVLKAIRILQPEVPVIIITGFSTVETAIEAMKNGAFDYLSKPFTPGQIVAKVQKALEQRAILSEHYFLEKEREVRHGFDLFIGESRPMQKVYRRILQVAPTDSTVLITGESGTGKELVARAIHRASHRRDRSFLAVDCTSLVETLLESELFGHVKGSFTGAIQTKTGLFVVADGGTLFLDEIANLSLTTQAKLLRVLQEREVVPIGGTRPIPVNIRLIAASNRNLKEMVSRGTFREDLYFRLNIIPIDLPPLRERQGDIPQLVHHFLMKYAAETAKDIRGLNPAAMSLLEHHDFPGNVRELENLIERAVVLSGGDLLQPEDLELDTGENEGVGWMPPVPTTADELKEVKRQVRESAILPIERAFVLEALKKNDWNVTKAAESVGMLRPNFQALMKKQGLSGRKEPTD